MAGAAGKNFSLSEAATYPLDGWDVFQIFGSFPGLKTDVFFLEAQAWQRHPHVVIELCSTYVNVLAHSF